MSIQYELAKLKRPIQTLPENSYCGDETIVLETSEYLYIAIFDGAGHGLSAYNISQRASAIINRIVTTYSLEDVILSLHTELRGTIGGVLAICKIHKNTAMCTCAVVGNISIKVFPIKERAIFSHGGVLGYEIHKPKISNFKLAANDVIVLHSDGINTNFSEDDIPDFYSLSAEQISIILIDYFSKTLDDASVIVLKVHND